MIISDLLSIQLYTLRALGDLDRILEVVAGAGYRHVETVHGHLDDPQATAARLAAHGLVAPSSHVDLEALRHRLDAVISACQALGLEQLFMPAVPADRRDMAAEGWRELGLELGHLAERLARQDIRLGYHNHDWDLAPKDAGRTALDVLFEAAGDSPLGWQADIAWLVRAGVEPKGCLARHGRRLISAHVKDLAPAGSHLDEDGWADVGAGVLDWPDLWRACRAAGARWMVVEHDRPRDPARTARASFAFLEGMEA